MLDYALLCLLGVIFSLALTPLARNLAQRLGAIDQPGARRIHMIATPRFGGPAILAALAIAMLLGSLLNGQMVATFDAHRREFGWLAIGAVMVTLVGAIDDVWPLRPRTKLLVEIAAASIVVGAGFRIELPPFHHLEALSFPVSVFFIVSVVNAVNLVDGLDGLAVGLCAIISLTLFVLCRSAGQLALSFVLAASCGAMLGFLRYNFHPARIFLGDSGALLLGFVVALGAIASSHQSRNHLGTIAPIVALGLPMLELVLTTIRRLLRARPLFAADRDHIHHRLLGLGFSHRNVVLLLYGAGAALCGLALTIQRLDNVVTIPLLAILMVACVAGVRWLGYLELRPKRSRRRLPVFEFPAIPREVVLTAADAASANAASHNASEP